MRTRVEREHPVALGEDGHLRREVPEVLTVAVQQHQRFPGAALLVVQPRAGGIDESHPAQLGGWWIESTLPCGSWNHATRVPSGAVHAA